VKIRNFGQKSLDELYDKLGEEGFLKSEESSDEAAEGEEGAAAEDSTDDTPADSTPAEATPDETQA
jgi:hypothetical protein